MMPGLDQAAHPLWFKSGRGGHIQYRIVAELPHEISPEARAEIVGKFCNHIAKLEEREDADGEVKKVGMMYTAVIHATTIGISMHTLWRTTVQPRSH